MKNNQTFYNEHLAYEKTFKDVLDEDIWILFIAYFGTNQNTGNLVGIWNIKSYTAFLEWLQNL